MRPGCATLSAVSRTVPKPAAARIAPPVQLLAVGGSHQHAPEERKSAAGRKVRGAPQFSRFDTLAARLRKEVDANSFSHLEDEGDPGPGESQRRETVKRRWERLELLQSLVVELSTKYREDCNTKLLDVLARARLRLDLEATREALATVSRAEQRFAAALRAHVGARHPGRSSRPPFPFSSSARASSRSQPRGLTHGHLDLRTTSTARPPRYRGRVALQIAVVAAAAQRSALELRVGALEAVFPPAVFPPAIARPPPAPNARLALHLALEYQKRPCLKVLCGGELAGSYDFEVVHRPLMSPSFIQRRTGGVLSYDMPARRWRLTKPVKISAAGGAGAPRDHEHLQVKSRAERDTLVGVPSLAARNPAAADWSGMARHGYARKNNGGHPSTSSTLRTVNRSLNALPRFVWLKSNYFWDPCSRAASLQPNFSEHNRSFQVATHAPSSTPRQQTQMNKSTTSWTPRSGSTPTPFPVSERDDRSSLFSYRGHVVRHKLLRSVKLRLGKAKETERATAAHRINQSSMFFFDQQQQQHFDSNLLEDLFLALQGENPRAVEEARFKLQTLKDRKVWTPFVPQIKTRSHHGGRPIRSEGGRWIKWGPDFALRDRKISGPHGRLPD